MSVIGKGVQIAHIVGVALVSSVFLFNLSVKSEPALEAERNSKLSNNGALIIVDTSNPDNSEDDGIITVEDNASESNDAVDDSLEIFKASREWKTVQKGQKIPPGLHVRLDLETGQNQAKLMDDVSQKTEQWDAGNNIGVINTEKKRFTRDELKAALKDFKYKDDTPEDIKEHEEEVKKNFRSYEELKKAMQDINMAIKTEGEIVTELVEKLKQPDIDHSHLKTLLTDLEYYLHQIDNAQLFCDLGGMKTMMELLNRTKGDIKESVIHTLGAALQSNPKVQVVALDSGLLQQLLRIMSADPIYNVRQKTLFAVSGLVRQFPFAQNKFLQLGGLASLADMFVSAIDDKLKIKIVTLLTDLLQEYDLNVKHSISEDALQVKRTLQYKQVPLREGMSTGGWCSLMTSLLRSPTEHDDVEKVVIAMSTLVDTCKHEFAPTRPKLLALLSKYKELSRHEKSEGSEDFFSSIYSTLEQLVEQIHREDL